MPGEGEFGVNVEFDPADTSRNGGWHDGSGNDGKLVVDAANT